MNPKRLLRPLAVILTVAACLSACSPDETPQPPLPIEETALARGRELAEGFAACGFCHSLAGQPGAPLSGGRLMRDKFGQVMGPNITPSETGIGSWSEAELVTLFRSFTRPDEGVARRSAHGGFEWLADTDLAAIVVYLRSLAPVKNELDRDSLTFVDRNTTGFFDAKPDVKGYVPRISDAFKAEYGGYIVDHVGRCGSCHTKPAGFMEAESYLGGGQTISFDGREMTAPNITQSRENGLGEWTAAEISKFLGSGVTKTGRRVDPKFCPVEFFARAPEQDRTAVAAYLKSVPAAIEE